METHEANEANAADGTTAMTKPHDSKEAEEAKEANAVNAATTEEALLEANARVTGTNEGSEFDANGIRLRSGESMGTGKGTDKGNGSDNHAKVYERQRREAALLLKAFESAPLQLVADDVGTGKTWVAMLVLFARLAEVERKRSISDSSEPVRAVVIAPTPLVQSKWARELRRFAKTYLADGDTVAVNEVRQPADVGGAKTYADGDEEERTGTDNFTYNTTARTQPAGSGASASSETSRLSSLSGLSDRPLADLLSTPEGRRAFLVCMHEQCIEQGWGGGKKEVRKILTAWQKRLPHYGAYRAAFRSVLPYGATHLLGSILAYEAKVRYAGMTERPYGANELPELAKRSSKQFAPHLRRWDAAVFKAASSSFSDSEAERWVDAFLRTASALWREDERLTDADGATGGPDTLRNRTPDPDALSVTLFEALAALEKKSTSSGGKGGNALADDVRALVTVLMEEGLSARSPRALEYAEKLLPEFAALRARLKLDDFDEDDERFEKETLRALRELRSEPDSTSGSDRKVSGTKRESGAKRLLDAVAAYAFRTDRLAFGRSASSPSSSGLPTGDSSRSILARHMRRFAAAAVFVDAEDLGRARPEASEAFDAADESNARYVERLAAFLRPVFRDDVLEGEVPPANRPSTSAIVLSMLVQLAAFDAAPERVGSPFWAEKRKSRVIDIVRMRTLRSWEEKTTKEGTKETTREALLPEAWCRSPLSIVVADEAHNWRRGAYGAAYYAKVLRPHVERVLLLTATPLQLEVNELKRIIDTALPPEALEHASEFKRAYGLLFGEEKNAGALLSKVSDKGKALVAAWQKLAFAPEARAVVETAAARLDDRASPEDKEAAWCELEKRGAVLKEKQDDGTLAEFVAAVRAYKKAQEEITEPLRRIVVKTRAPKVFESDPTVRRRRWFVGRETDPARARAARNDTDTHQARNARLHDAPGVANDAVWVSLIGMRTTMMPASAQISEGPNGTAKKTEKLQEQQKQQAPSWRHPHLLLGLPSSFEALAASAAGEGLEIKGSTKTAAPSEEAKAEEETQSADAAKETNAETEVETASVPASFPDRYRAFFRSVLRAAQGDDRGDLGKEAEEGKAGKENRRASHPKVRRTAEIVLDAWRRGEKTLVFCERIETVKKLRDHLTELLRRELDECPECPESHDLEPGTESAGGSLAARVRSAYAKCTDRAKAPGGGGRGRTPRVTVAIEAALAAAGAFYAAKFAVGQAEVEKRIAPWRRALLGAGTPGAQATNLSALSERSTYDARATWIVLSALREVRECLGKDDRAELARLLRFARGVSLRDADEETVKTELYVPVRTVTGGDENRGAVLGEFNSPFLPIALVCSTVSQEGVDMHRYCRTVVLHDLNWNPAMLEQRVGRLDRVDALAEKRNPPAPVEVFVPYLAESYDEAQFRRVLSRAEMQEAFFGRNDAVFEDDIETEERAKKKAKKKKTTENGREEGVASDDTPTPPLLGNLVYGYFEMDLSIEAERT